MMQMAGRNSTTVSTASPAAHMLELILEKRRVIFRYLSYAMVLSIDRNMPLSIAATVRLLSPQSFQALAKMGQKSRCADGSR
jgi:hypothetical protein